MENTQNDPLKCPKTVATLRWLNFGFQVLPMDGGNKLGDFGPISPFDHFRRYPDHTPAMRLPDRVVALVSDDLDQLAAYLKAIGAPRNLGLKNASKHAALFRLNPSDKLSQKAKLPDGIKLVRPGTPVRLPWGEHLEQSRIYMHSEDQMFELPFEVFQDEVDLTPKASVAQPTSAGTASVDFMADEAEPTIEPSELTGGDLDHDEPSELPIDSADDDPECEEPVAAEHPAPVAYTEEPTLLDRFSLRGKSDEIRKQIVDEKPLLGRLALTGQLSIWFGPTNAGKTLIFMALLNKAISEGRITGGQCYYINADDSGTGLLTKTELLEDQGCHTIAPGYQRFDASMVDDLLTKLAENSQANGMFVILDTAKKFVDPLNKRDSARFATICRKFSLKGGTMLVLAHTNKYPGANGKQQYAGAADLVQDFDAAYTIDVLSDGPDDKVIEFTKNKARGDSAESAAYAFNNQPSLTYPERLASVREVDPDQLHSLQKIVAQANDAEVIVAIKAAISAGSMSKMELAVHVAGRVSIGRNKVVNILERYQGDNAAEHLWYFETGPNGRKTYRLHGSPPAD